jgi:hypothetical protein|nr:hypothetical protein [uncultured Campylobacter sp.]
MEKISKARHPKNFIFERISDTIAERFKKIPVGSTQIKAPFLNLPDELIGDLTVKFDFLNKIDTGGYKQGYFLFQEQIIFLSDNCKEAQELTEKQRREIAKNSFIVEILHICDKYANGLFVILKRDNSNKADKKQSLELEKKIRQFNRFLKTLDEIKEKFILQNESESYGYGQEIEELKNTLNKSDFERFNNYETIIKKRGADYEAVELLKSSIYEELSFFRGLKGFTLNEIGKIFETEFLALCLNTESQNITKPALKTAIKELRKEIRKIFDLTFK